MVKSSLKVTMGSRKIGGKTEVGGPTHETSFKIKGRGLDKRVGDMVGTEGVTILNGAIKHFKDNGSQNAKEMNGYLQSLQHKVNRMKNPQHSKKMTELIGGFRQGVKLQQDIAITGGNNKGRKTYEEKLENTQKEASRINKLLKKAKTNNLNGGELINYRAAMGMKPGSKVEASRKEQVVKLESKFKELSNREQRLNKMTGLTQKGEVNITNTKDGKIGIWAAEKGRKSDADYQKHKKAADKAGVAIASAEKVSKRRRYSIPGTHLKTLVALGNKMSDLKKLSKDILGIPRNKEGVEFFEFNHAVTKDQKTLAKNEEYRDKALDIAVELANFEIDEKHQEDLNFLSGLGQDIKFATWQRINAEYSNDAQGRGAGSRGGKKTAPNSEKNINKAPNAEKAKASNAEKAKASKTEEAKVPPKVEKVKAPAMKPVSTKDVEKVLTGLEKSNPAVKTILNNFFGKNDITMSNKPEKQDKNIIPFDVIGSAEDKAKNKTLRKMVAQQSILLDLEVASPLDKIKILGKNKVAIKKARAAKIKLEKMGYKNPVNQTMKQYDTQMSAQQNRAEQSKTAQKWEAQPYAPTPALKAYSQKLFASIPEIGVTFVARDKHFANLKEAETAIHNITADNAKEFARVKKTFKDTPYAKELFDFADKLNELARNKRKEK